METNSRSLQKIDHRFPKSKTIKSKKDFLKILNEGKTIDSNLLRVFYRDSVSPKFAFIVSKKVAKSSVKRNRMRRLMKESVRLSDNQNIKSDIIFIAKTDFSKSKLRDIQLEVERIFSEIAK